MLLGTEMLLGTHVTQYKLCGIRIMCLSGVTCLHVDSCKSNDWLRIRIMCLSGVTCLHVDSCKSKDWLRIRIMCLSGACNSTQTHYSDSEAVFTLTTVHM
jgi:hypothetical protein